jgi:hypothetical protein
VIDLRFGRWQDVLDDVPSAVALIGDPPYSARTHEGQRTGSSGDTATVEYKEMTEERAAQIVALWHRRITEWVILFCDHVAFRWYEDLWSRVGWFTFAPVVWVKPDAAPRKVGDGPQTSVEQIFIARPPRFPSVRGSRPGHYVGATAELRGCGVAGSKPLALMQAIVRDYTQPGDLIVDPFAGRATTLIAADTEGRTSIGAECNADTYALARARIDAGYTRNLFSPTKKAKPKQEALL